MLMPWREVSIMESREEFCELALKEGANMSALCRRFEISRTTGYEWRDRYLQTGRPGLADRSRRPRESPWKTSAEIEDEVITLRHQHPAWGGRKLRAVLLRRGIVSPSASTITEILRRHELLSSQESWRQTPTRFEAPFPNDLWQMDYKGHFPLTSAARCHPLTVLDDHARFALGIRALSNQRETTVKAELIQLFERYGLPNRILCDNGSPWGTSTHGIFTGLAVWLLHLDVIMTHGRPLHPQTQGKDERFHRTLKDEVISTRSFHSLDHAQTAFDVFRHTYNHLRPHEALGLLPPITRYAPSVRSYPTQLPLIEYPDTAVVRNVTSRGVIKFEGREYYLGEAFSGYPVGLFPSEDDGTKKVFFRHYQVAQIDLRTPVEV
jgi:transposase InsO family protein